MEFLHNRISIDYAQTIIYNSLLRTDGAPFLGTGEKYFSMIDDTEVEIIKCLWETPAEYTRFAPPRRMWGMNFPELGEQTFRSESETSSYFIPRESYIGTFVKLADNMLQALIKLEELKNKADILVFNRIERGSFYTLAMQLKEWKKVYFFNGYEKAFNVIRQFILRFPEINEKQKLEFLNTKDNVVDINFIEEPCICIFNESDKSSTKLVADKHNIAETVITYNGRLHYD